MSNLHVPSVISTVVTALVALSLYVHRDSTRVETCAVHQSPIRSFHAPPTQGTWTAGAFKHHVLLALANITIPSSTSAYVCRVNTVLLQLQPVDARGARALLASGMMHQLVDANAHLAKNSTDKDVLPPLAIPESYRIPQMCALLGHTSMYTRTPKGVSLGRELSPLQMTTSMLAEEPNTLDSGVVGTITTDSMTPKVDCGIVPHIAPSRGVSNLSLGGVGMGTRAPTGVGCLSWYSLNHLSTHSIGKTIGWAHGGLSTCYFPSLLENFRFQPYRAPLGILSRRTLAYLERGSITQTYLEKSTWAQ